jgi:hypothetical protein
MGSECCMVKDIPGTEGSTFVGQLAVACRAEVIVLNLKLAVMSAGSR